MSLIKQAYASYISASREIAEFKWQIMFYKQSWGGARSNRYAFFVFAFFIMKVWWVYRNEVEERKGDRIGKEPRVGNELRSPKLPTGLSAQKMRYYYQRDCNNLFSLIQCILPVNKWTFMLCHCRLKSINQNIYCIYEEKAQHPWLYCLFLQWCTVSLARLLRRIASNNH